MQSTLYINGQIVTLDPARPRATAVRVQDGVVTELSATTPSASGARVVDLRGATLLPGLTDAHFHLQPLGAALREVALGEARSEAEAVERVARAAREKPRGTWIHGKGWNETRWPSAAPPTRTLLDAALPDHPALLTRVDFHAAWVNSAALAAAGIDARTADPPGGRIERDARGEPTGVLIDRAMELVSRAAPPPSAAVLRADLEAALERCRRAGLTTIHDMMLTADVLAVLEGMDAEGALSLRVRGYVHGEWEAVEGLLDGRLRGDGLLRINGVKLFADGALGSRGAALKAPYSDCPGVRGLLLVDPETLRARARRVHELGYQLAIHAIGDAANEVALGAIEAAQAGDTSRRHRIEHAQIVARADLERFARLGIVASVQPTHCTSDMHMAVERLGPERLAGAYAWRSLARAGTALALGSDAPIESENPWLGIYAAVTRQDAQGHPPDGFTPHERLTLDEALRGFTTGGAFAAHDARLGRVALGHAADFTVVDLDPYATDPSCWLEARTLMTVVGGRAVYSEL